MRTYYIEEMGMDMTYIELRLLLFVDCDLKYKKITEILSFLHTNGFLINLTTFISENIHSEDIIEQQDVMSLTIDFVNDKMRFKFWNGISTLWLYHVSDLFNALETGRNEFSQIYDKYEPVIDILLDFQRRWSTSIFHISYQYFPDENVEMICHIIFTEDVKNTNYANHIIDKINKEIVMLGKNVTENLNFRIEHSFKTSGCAPCEAARKKRNGVQNENN